MTLANRAGHNCSITQGSGNDISCFTGRCKATCDGQLTVILNDCGTFLAVVLLQLLVTLNDTHDAQLSGSGCAEHDFCGCNGWQRAKFITEEDHTVFQCAAVFIRHRQDLTVELLDQQGHHEVGVGVFFREDNEECTLSRTELFCINCCSEAQNLLQLRIQEAVQSGHGSRHDGLHCLF